VEINLRGIGVRKARFLGNLVVIRLEFGVLHDQELICRQMSMHALTTGSSYKLST
jgi:hypothetical protein